MSSGNRAVDRDALPERGEDARDLHPQGEVALEKEGIAGEIIVSDNGSTDGSQGDRGASGRARVVDAPVADTVRRWPGGIAEARGPVRHHGGLRRQLRHGQYRPFIRLLREGNDLVMGNRFRGGSWRARCRRATGISATRP